MNVEEIRRHLKVQPFVPFRIHLSDGSHYDVPHPDFAFVTKAHVEIGLGPVSAAIPERSVSCDPLHVTRIEPMPGERSRRTG